MFLGLFSFSSKNLSYYEFSRFSLRGQLHRPEDTKCNVLDWQTAKINSITESFWVSRIFVIDSSRSTYYNYSYSFGKQPAARVFKNKNCCFPEQGNVSHHTKKNLTITQKKSLLKKNLTYSSIFKVYSLKSFLLQRHLLFLLKTDAEAAVRKCSSK